LGKRKAFKIVSIILLLCALAYGTYELMHLRKITVAGCETKTEEEIISMTGLEMGKSMLEINTEEIEDSIGADPYIKTVSVTSVFPDRIAIKIEERKETACIKNGEALLVFDEEGWLLKILTDTDTAPYTLVLGLQLNESKVGSRLGAADIFQLDVLSSVLKEAKAASIALKSIDISFAAYVTLETENGFTVELGNDMLLPEKFRLLASAMAEIIKMQKTGGIIDVASGSNVYYREK